MAFNFKIYLILFLPILISTCAKKQNYTLFTKLPADSTGITFSNNILETNARNVFNFEYLYNGGGVALGDFNNDNFVDIYFTGNQVSNKLYLSKGKTNGEPFKFTDITSQSGATGEGRWCTGAAVIDINNDNRLDLYVCATNSKVADRLANMMYVNQGNDAKGIPIFKNMAAEYGIADTTHTTNAAFFDYDNDGDLDLYLLVNEMEKVRYPNKYVDKIVDGSSKRTDKLYKNDGTNEKPHFTDVSKKAGILIEGYGLGLNITDINKDGWKDIYITNDFLSDDLLYINNKNGTFTDQSAKYFKHTSYSAMGNDVTDLNNDGLVDLVALDMLPKENERKKMMLPGNNYSNYQNNEKFGYNYQYPRNTLQLNQGTDIKTGQPVFSEVGLMAGIAESDWSWCPLVTDFDNDGFRDMIFTNGFPKDVTDHDYLAYRYQSAVSQQLGLDELLQLLPSRKVANFAFKNKTTVAGEIPQFENVSLKWGMDTPSFSNGAAYADFDHDGDLDYVVNNINDSAFVFRNNAKQQMPLETNFLKVKCIGNKNNINGIGAVIEIEYGNNQKQFYENTPFRGYLSTLENISFFGLGNQTKIKAIKVSWSNNKVNIFSNIVANQTIIADEEKAISNNSPILINNSPIFENVTDEIGSKYIHNEEDFVDYNIQKLLPHKFSQFDPSMAVGDINGDKLEDVFVAGSKNNKGIFLVQNKNGGFQEKDLIVGETNETKFAEDAGALLFDAEGDGDLDLYIVTGSNEWPTGSNFYQDKLYANDGKGNFSLLANALPTLLESGSCVRATDFDHDGDLDLMVGGRVEPNAYPKPVASRILRNDSKSGIKFVDITASFAPELLNIGLVCDALWTDYDNDGWHDLMLVGEYMPIQFLKNEKGKKLVLAEIGGLKNDLGFWNSISAGDYDNDGDIDYVVGNQGFNTLNNVSPQYPFKIYAKDFNNDGYYDVVPTIFLPNQKNEKLQVPFNNRDDLIKQMTYFKDKFPSYKSYSEATIKELFSEEELINAQILTINNTVTTYIENLGTGDFKTKPMPMQCQTAPINGMITDDFDADGNLDLLMIGNNYGNEIMIGKLDAFNGLFLKGDGKGSFVPTNLSKSGFLVPGDAKGLVKLLNANNETLIFASQNKGPIACFKTNISQKNIPLSNQDVSANIYLSAGKKRKVEKYFGSSFASQSNSCISFNKNIKKVEIIDNRGKGRFVSH